MEGMGEVLLAKASSEVFGGTRIGEDMGLFISRVFISCNHMGSLAFGFQTALQEREASRHMKRITDYRKPPRRPSTTISKLVEACKGVLGPEERGSRCTSLSGTLRSEYPQQEPNQISAQSRQNKTYRWFSVIATLCSGYKGLLEAICHLPPFLNFGILSHFFH
jgi:hypothetical protein